MLALGGCAVGPDFHRPRAPDTDRYLPTTPPPEASEGTASATPPVAPQRLLPGDELAGEWWQLFHAPVLQDAVRAALTGSPTLAAANATLAEAQQQVIVARGALFPKVDASAGVTHTASSTPTPLLATNQYTLGVSATYALDIFGGARRGVEQQVALADMQRYQLAAAYLTLTGGVVTEALTIASTRLQIATTLELIESDKKNLELTQREYEIGRAARADVLTADSQLAADLTTLPSLRTQLEQARDALAVLTGHAPAAWTAHDFDVGEFTLPKELPLALPSQLARQRPDILAAEAQLHAASAAIGVAFAQEFPNLTLSGSLARTALTAGALFHHFETQSGGGALLTAPIFAGGALRAQTEAARDALKAQAATYQGVVVAALGQVTDDLWALKNDAERMAVDQHSVDIALEALKLQQASYTVGKSSVLQLIDAERTYAQARLSLATAQIQQYQDTAGLLVALGGGWWKDPAAAPR
ncbi:MAG TPA: efflux transporter outer membrane subunit [Steroidobacteraceae bacterium]|nr:efflux transporter outer membrane subunit [Steroidobacteraceae bacterium]